MRLTHGGPHGHMELHRLKRAVQRLATDILAIDQEVHRLVIPLDDVGMGLAAGVLTHIHQQEVLLTTQKHIGLDPVGIITLELKVDLILVGAQGITKHFMLDYSRDDYSHVLLPVPASPL